MQTARLTDIGTREVPLHDLNAGVWCEVKLGMIIIHMFFHTRHKLQMLFETDSITLL
jgi:hypothetical protein